MSIPHQAAFKTVALLPRTRVSELKTRGWRSVMEGVQSDGGMVITYQNRPEAVILTIAEYGKLVEATRRESERKQRALNDLRADYDARLEVLQAAGAAETLLSLMRQRTKRDGKGLTGAEI